MTPTQLTPARLTTTQRVRRLFALPPRKRKLQPVPEVLLRQALPSPGQITLITGPSGAGKSRFLTALRNRSADRPVTWIDPAAIKLPSVSVIDLVCDALTTTGGEPAIENALELLSRVGLAEAWTYLQKPAELSDGQRWRLMLALGVATAIRVGQTPSVAVLAMDEFAALLDRVTARIVARALRRLIDRHIGDQGATLGAVVATSHHDLLAALQPELIVRCDFDRYDISGVAVSAGCAATSAK
ncbi:MAG: hypothetical protein ACTHLN_05800 [Tepidisphaeraceae bacterium]